MANSSGSLTLLQLQAALQAAPQAVTDVRIFKMFLVMGIHVLFIYINLVMLFTVWSKPSLRHTARYILFAHLLFNDTLHLAVGLLLYVLSALSVMLVRAACALAILLSVCTFTNAPLNLAVMSLERYTAVCFPLRHGELATPQRTRLALGVVWALGCVGVLIDVCALFLAEPSFSLSPAICTMEQLQRAGWQREKGLAVNVLLLVAVVTVLLFTYVAIMLAARSASSDAGSARRALRTVLLHVLQLGLSQMSFLYTLLESLLARFPLAVFVQMRFVNFLFVLLLPRCLSALIYGLRDEAVRPLFRQHFTRCNGRRAASRKG